MLKEFQAAFLEFWAVWDIWKLPPIEARQHNFSGPAKGLR